MTNLDLIDDLLKDESITEIMLNGTKHTYFEKNGTIHTTNQRFKDEAQLYQLIDSILKPLGKQINENTPFADTRLPNGSRVNIIIPPLSRIGPIVTIRKFSKIGFSSGFLLNSDSLSSNMIEFLKICVEAKKNIIISGGTGSGKTSLLNVISSFIPNSERIITIEDVAELRLNQEHVCPLESKTPDAGKDNGITIRQLVINALRMRPDRIIVGECRSGEALDMLQAMNTGHSGSLTTVHSNSPRDCLKRLEIMVLMAGFDLPVRAIREQIASAINVIVQLSRFSDGSRKIVNISEVTGMEGDVITLSPLYEFNQKGIDKKIGKIIGEFKATGVVPSFIDELRAKGAEINFGIFE